MVKKARDRGPQEAGLSSVEFIIAVVLTAIIGLVMAHAMVSAYRTWRLHRDLALVLESVTVDVGQLAERCSVASSMVSTGGVYSFEFPQTVGGVTMEPGRSADYSRIIRMDLSLQDGRITEERVRELGMGHTETNTLDRVPSVDGSGNSVGCTAFTITNPDLTGGDRCRISVDVECSRRILNRLYTNAFSYGVWFRMYNKRIQD